MYKASEGEVVLFGNKEVKLLSDGSIIFNDHTYSKKETSVECFMKECRELVLYVGGGAGYGGLDGAFCANVNLASSSLSRGVGARFQELEKKYSVKFKGLTYDKDSNVCIYKLEHNGIITEIKW